MSTKWSNPPPPSKKPPVCKKTPTKPPAGSTPVGTLHNEWEVHTGPPGPTFDLAGHLFLYQSTATTWYSPNWPAVTDGAVAEFIYQASSDEWQTTLKYFIGGVWQFDLFVYWTANPGHAPFDSEQFPYQSGQVNGDMFGWIFTA